MITVNKNLSLKLVSVTEDDINEEAYIREYEISDELQNELIKDYGWGLIKEVGDIQSDDLYYISVYDNQITVIAQPGQYEDGAESRDFCRIALREFIYKLDDIKNENNNHKLYLHSDDSLDDDEESDYYRSEVGYLKNGDVTGVATLMDYVKYWDIMYQMSVADKKPFNHVYTLLNGMSMVVCGVVGDLKVSVGRYTTPIST